MTGLALLFFIKIAVTLPFVALPFLFLPKARLNAAMSVDARKTTLFRLYGVAMMALLAGYGGGIWQVSQKIFPWGVIAMGIISNGGASFVLVKTGAVSRAKLLTGFFIAVTVGLLVAAARPDIAMTKIF